MKRVIIGAIAALTLLVGCSGQAEVDAAAQDQAATPPATVEADATTPAPSAPNDVEPVPVPYVPAGRPGTAQAYDELVQRLEEEVPAEYRREIPWPDLRNPDPVVAQVEIFELWIWMEANLPEPVLVEIMAAPRSPSREEIATVFGELDRENVLQIRRGQGYQAFDHLVVTFESAGLPLWLGRDVPADAVVVYYSDSSGPVDIIDRDTGQFLDSGDGTSLRTWLSIMVPTDVGWQLWRDQQLDASNGLEVPELPPVPGATDQERTPEV